MPVARRSPRDVAIALLRMSKLAVYQHFYPWIAATLLVSTAALKRPGAAAALACFFVATVAIVAATAAVDDITGYLNGSDAVNYKQGEGGYRRDLRRKPLLSGAISLRQAVVFGIVTEAAGLACGVAGFAILGWHVPPLAIALFFIAAVLTPQYSGGLAFSYHRGGSELLLGGGTAAGVVFQYVAFQQRWSAAALLEGLVLGLFLVMLISCSNVIDADGDAAVGRHTIPAIAGLGTVKALMVLYAVAAVGMMAALTTLMGAGWAALAMAPSVALLGYYVWLGPAQEKWGKARFCAFIGYDVGFLGLIVCDILAR